MYLHFSLEQITKSKTMLQSVIVFKALDKALVLFLLS